MAFGARLVSANDHVVSPESGTSAEQMPVRSSTWRSATVRFLRASSTASMRYPPCAYAPRTKWASALKCGNCHENISAKSAHGASGLPASRAALSAAAAAAGGEARRNGGRKNATGCVRAREEGPADGGPTHEGRDRADDSTDPGVPEGAALHGGVGSRVERDVRGAEEGRRRVAHRPEEGGARDTGRRGERGGVGGAEGAADEGPRTGACHLRVVGYLLQLVERVGRGAAERGAERCREQYGDGRGDWGERDAGHGDEHVEGGEAGFG
jgi:hypothetical protein